MTAAPGASSWDEAVLVRSTRLGWVTVKEPVLTALPPGEKTAIGPVVAVTGTTACS